MVRKRRSKTKTKRKAKKRSAPRTKKRSDLEILKEQQSKLYSRVSNNLDIILRQTQITREELGEIIDKLGYEAIPKLDGFDIIQPIWEKMVKTFKLYDKIASLVERMEVAENRLFINQLEKKTLEVESQLKAIEDEEKFYTKKDRDSEGMIKMKEKYYAEKEHWELKKAEAEQKLKEDPENTQAQNQLEVAERALKELSSKRWKVRLQNIQPGITKWSKKIGKGVNTVQDSIAEISKPFQEIGDGYGYNPKKKTNTNQYEEMFSPEKVFNTKKSKKKNDDYGGFF